MCPAWPPEVSGLLWGHFALSCLLLLINIQPHENNPACLSFNHGIVPMAKPTQVTLTVKSFWILYFEWDTALAPLGLQEKLKIGDPKPCEALPASWGPRRTLEFSKEHSTCSLFKRLPTDLLGDKKRKENCYSLLCSLFPELFDILEKSWILSDAGPMLRAAWAVSPGCGSCDIWEAAPSLDLYLLLASRFLIFPLLCFSLNTSEKCIWASSRDNSPKGSSH